MDEWGSATFFADSYPFLISKTSFLTHFGDEFLRSATVLNKFLPISA